MCFFISHSSNKVIPTEIWIMKWHSKCIFFHWSFVMYRLKFNILTNVKKNFFVITFLRCKCIWTKFELNIRQIHYFVFKWCKRCSFQSYRWVNLIFIDVMSLLRFIQSISFLHQVAFFVPTLSHIIKISQCIEFVCLATSHRNFIVILMKRKKID